MQTQTFWCNARPRPGHLRLHLLFAQMTDKPMDRHTDIQTSKLAWGGKWQMQTPNVGGASAAKLKLVLVADVDMECATT